MTKYIIFDAGPIISMSMNGLLPLLEKLKENFDGKFILTPAVKREVVDKPMRIKEFKIEAIKVKYLIEKGVFTMSSDVVANSTLLAERDRILKAANGVLRSTKSGQKIKILHEGEAACLAFANLCDCDNVLVVDERTTRMLFEDPNSVREMFAHKTHGKVDSDFSLLSGMKDFKFIRSTELVYIAYKKGLIEYGHGKDVLEALLYALKFKGTTISSKEIELVKRMA